MVQVLNRKIKDIQLTYDELFITFENDEKIVMFDNSDGCCEDRYIKTLYNLRNLIGEKILSCQYGIRTEIDDDHEILEIQLDTTNGRVNLVFNNVGEHPGINVMFEKYQAFKCEEV